MKVWFHCDSFNITILLLQTVFIIIIIIIIIIIFIIIYFCYYYYYYYYLLLLLLLLFFFFSKWIYHVLKIVDGRLCMSQPQRLGQGNILAITTQLCVHYLHPSCDKRSCVCTMDTPPHIYTCPSTDHPI